MGQATRAASVWWVLIYDLPLSEGNMLSLRYSKCSPRTSSGNTWSLLEMHSLGPQPRPSDSERTFCLSSHADDLFAGWHLRGTLSATTRGWSQFGVVASWEKTEGTGWDQSAHFPLNTSTCHLLIRIQYL